MNQTTETKRQRIDELIRMLTAEEVGIVRRFILGLLRRAGIKNRSG